MLFQFAVRVGPPRAPGWPETDSPRKTIASSGVETQIRALETPFVAIFRFWNQKQLGTKVFGGFIPWAPPKAQNTENLGLGPWCCAEQWRQHANKAHAQRCDSFGCLQKGSLLGWAMDFLGIYVVYGDCQFLYEPFINPVHIRYITYKSIRNAISQLYPIIPLRPCT